MSIFVAVLALAVLANGTARATRRRLARRNHADRAEIRDALTYFAGMREPATTPLTYGDTR